MIVAYVVRRRGMDNLGAAGGPLRREGETKTCDLNGLAGCCARLAAIFAVALAAVVMGAGADAWAQVAAVTAPSVPAAESLSARGQAALLAFAEAGNLPELYRPNFTRFRAQVMRFYRERDYALAWVRGRRPTPQAIAITDAFVQAAGKGLEPEDYDVPNWGDRFARLRRTDPPVSDTDLARFDLELTVCVMRYLSDLHMGRIDPRVLRSGFDVEKRQIDLADFLGRRLVNARPEKIGAILSSVEPQFGAYQRVEKALQHYIELSSHDEGQSFPLPGGRVIDPGDRYAAVPQLARYLRLLGDLPQDAIVNIDPPIYRGALVQAVEHFQRRHGLQIDGRIGPKTIRQLDIPLTWRVEQLRLSLERWRWVPQQFSHPPIIVNIPEFKLRCWDAQHHNELQMRVIVGRAYRRRTPLFAAMMRYVIFRPYWNVPLSIERHELVPKIAANPGYMARHDYEIVTRDHVVVSRSNPSAAMMAGMRSGRLLIRQRPGDENALGLVKFIFPNHYNVYLHGTPHTELFARARRDFSHGCIRVQKPAELAAWVLRDLPGWDLERVEEAMHGPDDVKVDLARPIPVLIIYTTAVVPRSGEVCFFDDIYGYDDELARALADGYPPARNPDAGAAERG